MNELSTTAKQLPDNLEDLTRFTLIGREKLKAVRAEIRAIEKVGLAKEVHEQKLQEAQEIAEAVLDAEAKIGELTSKMEKATANQYVQSNTAVTKQNQLDSIGISKMQASRFETLARHPQAIERAKATAKAEGRIVTRQDVFHDISATEYPTRQQKEEQELREAKSRARDYQVSDGKVTNFGDAKRHKDDNELIFNEFKEKVRKMRSNILSVLISAENPETMGAIQTADRRELIALNDKLSESYRTILKLQRKIAEVIDEKQSK